LRFDDGWTIANASDFSLLVLVLEEEQHITHKEEEDDDDKTLKSSYHFPIKAAFATPPSRHILSVKWWRALLITVTHTNKSKELKQQLYSREESACVDHSFVWSSCNI
jgi:hypothetical protein